MAEAPEFHWEPLELRRPLLFKSGRFHFCAILVGHLGYILGGYQTLAPSKRFKPNHATVINFNENTWEEKPISGWTPRFHEGFSAHLVRDGVLALFPFYEDLCHLLVLDLPLLSWKMLELKSKRRIKIDKHHVADYWEEEEMLLVNTARATLRGSNSRIFAVYLLTGEIKAIQSKGTEPTGKGEQSSLLMPAQKKWYIFGGKSSPPGLFVCDFTVMRSPVWTELARIGCRGIVSSATLLHFKDKLCVLGGTRPFARTAYQSEVFTYDIRSNTWQTEDHIHLGSMPSKLEVEFHNCLIISKRTVYIIPSRARGTNSYFKLELVDR